LVIKNGQANGLEDPLHNIYNILHAKLNTTISIRHRARTRYTICTNTNTHQMTDVSHLSHSIQCRLSGRQRNCTEYK